MAGRHSRGREATDVMDGTNIETLFQQLLERLQSIEEQVARLTRQLKDATEAIDKLRKKF
jgi:phage shock protein A